MPIQAADLIAPAQAARKNAAQSPGGEDGAFGRMVEAEGSSVKPAPVDAADPASPDASVARETPMVEDRAATKEVASAEVDLALLLGIEPVPVAPIPAIESRAPLPPADQGEAVTASLPGQKAADTEPPAIDEVSGDDASGIEDLPSGAEVVAEGDATLDRKASGTAEPAAAVPPSQLTTVPAATIAVTPPQPGQMLRELAALRREGVLEVRGTAETAKTAAVANADAAKPVTDKAGRSFAEIFAAASNGEPAFEGLSGDRPSGEAVVLPGAERAIGTEHAARLQTGHTQASSHAAATNVPISGLSTEIAARAAKGMTQFEIRLDPTELGKVDVSLKIDSEGQVVSRLVVERAETLELLKSDQRALERALEQAGLRTEQGALQFELRNGNGGSAGRERDDAPRLGASGDEAGDAGTIVQQLQSAGRRGATGVDIRI